MSGLKRMVELRGGLLEGFDHCSLLQRTMAWADFSYATAANKSLAFPLIPKLATSLGLKDKFMSRSMVANTEALGPSDLRIQNREVIELFELLYSVTDSISHTFDEDPEHFAAAADRSSPAPAPHVSNAIYLLEWRLCQLEEAARGRRQRPAARAESLPITMPSEDRDGDAWLETAPPADLSPALLYAAHLFLHLAVRGQPPAAHRHRALAEALMSSLCDTLVMLDLLSSEPLDAAARLGSPASFHSTSSAGPLSTAESWSSSASETSHASPPGWSPPRSSSSSSSSNLHENILLWILFVGACVRMPRRPNDDATPFLYRGVLLGGGGDPHEFFARALGRCCRARGLADRAALRDALRDTLWLGSWCDGQLDLVWQEIGDFVRI